MDLERCPKCGNAWIAGLEKCRGCGFVPIGAGLKNVPKKKKRHGRYVEPGSARGLLSIVFLGLLGFGAYRYQPWQDDWEMIRVMLGQGRRHSIVGDWDIVKTLTIKRDLPVILGQKAVQGGMINFSKAGALKMVLDADDGKTTTTGRYAVSGLMVAMNSLQSSSESLGIPKTMKLNVSWTGPDEMLATVGGEVVYMRRRDDKNPVAKLIKVGLNGKSEAPGSMRGMVSQLERTAEDGHN